MITRRSVLAGTGGLAAIAAAGPPTNAAGEGKVEAMQITRAGSQPSGKGPAEWFTGMVRIDPLFTAPPTGACRRRGRHVRAWRPHRLAHAPARPDLDRHPGVGWVQREGGPIEEIRPGDVVWFPPGEKHWHGATATTAMTHIAIQEALDGKAVDWLEHVSDEQYGARADASSRSFRP